MQFSFYDSIPCLRVVHVLFFNWGNDIWHSCQAALWCSCNNKRVLGICPNLLPLNILPCAWNWSYTVRNFQPWTAPIGSGRMTAVGVCSCASNFRIGLSWENNLKICVLSPLRFMVLSSWFDSIHICTVKYITGKQRPFLLRLNTNKGYIYASLCVTSLCILLKSSE